MVGLKKIIFCFAVFTTIFSYSQEEKRLALVIGNANYEKGELKNPVNDARLIASTLDSLDFDVILKENLATKRDMTAAIREFGSKRSEYDVAFVYYAGHGIQVDDENFLLPTKEVFEEEFDVMDYGVSVQSIMRYLEAQTNEVNILILDACRDNPYESNWNKTRSLKGGGLAKIPPPTGSLIAFSTDSGQTAPDGDGDNSVYTISLAKNMIIENISIDQLFRNVRQEVLLKTNQAQRPVEATQLVGKSFILNRTFSIYNSSLNEIINFCKEKLLNQEFEQAIEVLNAAGDHFKSKNKVKEEVFVRKFLVDEYAFNKLEDQLPKYLSLYLRNLDYSNLTREDYKIHFKEKEYRIFIKNLTQLINFDQDIYSEYVDRNYYMSLYYALKINLAVIENNYFDLSELISFPDYNHIGNKSDALLTFWENKIKHIKFRTDPLSEGKHLIRTTQEICDISQNFTKSFLDNLLNEAKIITTSDNNKLIDYTLSVYSNIAGAQRQISADIIFYNRSNNYAENLRTLEKIYPEYETFFKSHDLNRIEYLGDFSWYILALQAHISSGIFYSSSEDEFISQKIKHFKEITEYLIFVQNFVKEINFDDISEIEKYNSFIKITEFRPNAFIQLKNYFLSNVNEDKFVKSKEGIINAYESIIERNKYYFNLINDINNGNFELLEDRDFFENANVITNLLLFKLYQDYLTKSVFKTDNKPSSVFEKKVIEYEKEYKLNYINRFVILKNLNWLKELSNNRGFFEGYEFVPSTIFIERLIETNFGTKDDILFTKYAEIYSKLYFSSKTNFCYDPFSLSNKLESLKSENIDNQNFLLNAYIDELDIFFNINSEYYFNCLNHYNEVELKTLFKNSL